MDEAEGPPPGEIPIAMCDQDLVLVDTDKIVLALVAPLAFTTGIETRLLLWARPGVLRFSDAPDPTQVDRGTGDGLHLELTTSAGPTTLVTEVQFRSGSWYEAGAHLSVWLPVPVDADAAAVALVWDRLELNGSRPLDLPAVRDAQQNVRRAFSDRPRG